MTTWLATLPEASLIFVCDIVFCIKQFFGLHRVISYICICSITSGISPTLRLPAKSRGGYIGIYSSIYSLVKIVHYDWSEYRLLSFYYLFLTRFLVCKVIMFLTVIYTGKDVVCVMTANFKCIFFFYLNIQAFLEECPVILYLYKMCFFKNWFYLYLIDYLLTGCDWIYMCNYDINRGY